VRKIKGQNMKHLNVLKNIGYVLLVTVLVAVAIFVVAGRFGIGGVRALVVQSGSMEPAIPAKSIVFSAPSENYSEGDIITFAQSGRSNVLVTHRVVNVENLDGGKVFTTKGDANEDADGEKVPAKDVVGEVLFSIPFVGAIVSFAQTLPGFVALIIVPAVIIVYSEILNIKKEVGQIYRERKGKKGVNRISYEKLNS
jgi:signal peptidase I